MSGRFQDDRVGEARPVVFPRDADFVTIQDRQGGCEQVIEPVPVRLQPDIQQVRPSAVGDDAGDGCAVGGDEQGDGLAGISLVHHPAGDTVAVDAIEVPAQPAHARNRRDLMRGAKDIGPLVQQADHMRLGVGQAQVQGEPEPPTATPQQIGAVLVGQHMARGFSIHDHQQGDGLVGRGLIPHPSGDPGPADDIQMAPRFGHDVGPGGEMQRRPGDFSLVAAPQDADFVRDGGGQRQGHIEGVMAVADAAQFQVAAIQVGGGVGDGLSIDQHAQGYRDARMIVAADPARHPVVAGDVDHPRHRPGEHLGRPVRPRPLPQPPQNQVERVAVLHPWGAVKGPVRAVAGIQPHILMRVVEHRPAAVVDEGF